MGACRRVTDTCRWLTVLQYMGNKQTKVMCVMAPGRSCSSGVAKALHYGGWPMGETLLAPDLDNPEGYFEDVNLVFLNGRILAAHPEHWEVCAPVPAEDPSILAEVEAYIRGRGFGQWGMKEPSLVLTWPYFEKAFKSFPQLEPIVVGLFRDPVKVAASGSSMGLYGKNDFELVKYYQSLIGRTTY